MPPALRFSCVIPTFNRGMVLVRSIETLLDQKVSAHEIIVVDQSTVCPEEARMRLERWRDAKSIQWIRQEEPNASMARNRGALAATGDVIVFLDDDIEVESDYILRWQRVFEDAEIECASGQVLEGQGETVSVLDSRADDPEIGWLYGVRNSEQPRKGLFLMAGNMAVRREPFMSVGGMDEWFMKGAFREEADFAMRWGKSGRVVHYRPDVPIFHLGVAGISDGGARHWTRKNHWTGWHHFFGFWYFFFNHAQWRALHLIFAGGLRSIGCNKRILQNRPWTIPFHFCRWISAIPLAIYARIKGPRLIKR